MGLRTIRLKLRKPSNIKSSIMETALQNYNNAFNFLLKKAHENIEMIEKNYKSPKGKYSTLGVSKWINRDLSDQLNQFDVQPFKDSIKLDFGMLMVSYFVQKAANPKMCFPGYKAEEVKPSDKLRPIYFCRYDTKRNFSLLYDEINDKYFVKLYLMNSKNAKVRDNHKLKRELVYISKKGEKLKSLKKETFLILPLSFGRWQENMLKLAIKQPEILRTALLNKDGDEYYLSLTIDLPEDQKIEADTFMGISRGIEHALNYSVVDMQGNLVASGMIQEEDFTNRANNKNNICIMANRISDLAVQHKSTVVLQKLVGKGDRLSWGEEGRIYKPTFRCKLYNELARVLEYKLPQKGLPNPVKVSSVDIFHRCFLCGANTRKNRFSKTMFICTTCGMSYNLDMLGSLNLASKLMKYENTTLKLRARKTDEGVQLQNELIGLDLFVSQNENVYEKLKEEINRMMENVNETSETSILPPKDINNIIMKVIKQDFANIEIV